MRVVLFLPALTLLAACATASGPAAPGPAPSVASPRPSQALQLLSRAGGEEAPSRAEVERELGAPDIARQDGAGAALTYRFENCALLLLFVADPQNNLRLAEAHASARRAGAAAPGLDQCATEAAGQ